MKLSEVWLREWVNPAINTEQLAEQLTLAGLEVEQISALEEDNLFDIGITPNRADCLSVSGLAREVALLNQLSVQEPSITPVPVILSESIALTLEAVNACPYYSCRVLQSINASLETPAWIQQSLLKCGIQPTGSVVVDITNYVQIEFGQPLHAFDRDSITGEVVVRFASKGEPITLLNQQSTVLSENTLVIADQHHLLAIAGVMGGLSSSVQSHTQTILLESAHFTPRFISGQARRYGIHSEAAYRFERGVDPALPLKALERATSLLLTICGGKAGPIQSFNKDHFFPQLLPIQLRYKAIERLIGHPFAADWVHQQLLALGCQVQPIAGGWEIVPPTWRFDLSLEVDLIEEMARLYGYHRLPSSSACAPVTWQLQSETSLPLNRLSTLLIDRGYHEVITYSFVDPQQQQLLHPQQPALILPHPISVKLSAMRLSLWSGLLTTLLYNQRRQQQRIRLFEIGLRFIPNPQAELAVIQQQVVAGIIQGDRDEMHWDLTQQSVDFFDIKGDIEALFALTERVDVLQFKVGSHPALHPGQSADIYYQEQLIGYIGALHPKLVQQFEISGVPLLFELMIEPLLQSQIPRAQEISRFPTNRRDLALVVPEAVAVQAVIDLCQQVAKDELIKLHLFDVYRGSTIPTGYKSLAVALWFQSSRHTLEESEITTIVARITTALEQRFQASLRN